METIINYIRPQPECEFFHNAAYVIYTNGLTFVSEWIVPGTLVE